MKTLDPAKKSLSERLQQKLAESRFLTFSLLLHVVLIVLVGSVVLINRVTKTPELLPPSAGIAEAPVDNSPKIEAPVVPVDAPVPASAKLSPPPVSAIVTTNLHAAKGALVSNIQPTLRAPSGLSPGSISQLPGIGRGPNFPGPLGDRIGKGRENAIRKGGGNPAVSEKSVLAGLRWLKEHQSADGSWSSQHTPAMTGLALLCFLGHGELPESPEFGATVKKGLDWLLAKGKEHDGRMSMTKSGWGGNAGVYEHAIATYAMAEYYAMTRDDRYAALLEKAVGYIVAGQAPDGGWNYGYSKESNSDTSVTGWQVQALKAAHLCDLKIAGVDEAMEKAVIDLRRVQGSKGGFGYRGAENKYSLTGVGVLCTYFVTQHKDAVVKDGMKFLLQQSEIEYPVKYMGEQANLYAWYYNTQACLMYGGQEWVKWHRMFEGEIVGHQAADGSWPVTGGKNTAGGLEKAVAGAGPFYRTTLSVLMLEAYYRYAQGPK